MDLTRTSTKAAHFSSLLAVPPLISLLLVLLPGCSGPQSTLQPAGTGAEQIAQLFWWMAGGTVVIWALVLGLALYATQIRPEAHNRRAAGWLIVGGGVVTPTIVLAVLLVYGLQLMPSLRGQVEPGLEVSVSGERWWWRVRYPTASGESVELANEIRMPVGESVAFNLTSPDVIHSFWIPSLGGKVDMVPGRMTTLTLQPTKTGTYSGACAEYCGSAHALMNFRTVVMEPEAFNAWLEHQAEPAEPPRDPIARQGLEAFLANGCSACHTIRGTPADGVLGPDLTHVGSRLSLGAGILPNEEEAFARWITHTGEIKPGVNMPEFGMLPPEQVTAIATYLDGLK